MALTSELERGASLLGDHVRPGLQDKLAVDELLDAVDGEGHLLMTYTVATTGRKGFWDLGNVGVRPASICMCCYQGVGFRGSS